MEKYFVNVCGNPAGIPSSFLTSTITGIWSSSEIVARDNYEESKLSPCAECVEGRRGRGLGLRVVCSHSCVSNRPVSGASGESGVGRLRLRGSCYLNTKILSHPRLGHSL